MFSDLGQELCLISLMDATAKIELLSIENLYLNLFDIFILLFEELTYRSSRPESNI